MNFDADAYAEGICNSAAGSSIEMLVDTIDATISKFDTYQAMLTPLRQNDEALEVVRLAEHWTELRVAIVEREREYGDASYLEREDDDDEEDEEEDGPDRSGVELTIEAIAVGGEAFFTVGGDEYTVIRNGTDKDGDWTVWEDGEHYPFDTIDAVLDFMGL